MYNFWNQWKRFRSCYKNLYARFSNRL